MTTVSRATTPAPPGRAAAAAPSFGTSRSSNSSGSSDAPLDDHAAAGIPAPASFLHRRQQRLNAAADTRPEDAGHEHELRLGRGRHVGRELDSLHVDLVADEVDERREALGIG